MTSAKRSKADLNRPTPTPSLSSTAHLSVSDSGTSSALIAAIYNFVLLGGAVYTPMAELAIRLGPAKPDYLTLEVKASFLVLMISAS